MSNNNATPARQGRHRLPLKHNVRVRYWSLFMESIDEQTREPADQGGRSVAQMLDYLSHNERRRLLAR